MLGSLNCWILVVILLYTSCTTNDNSEIKNNEIQGIEKSIDDKIDSVMNNPVLFNGSSFGEFFQILHKTGEYGTMITYTSGKTKTKYNKEQLLDFYEKMNFSYPLKLKAFKNNLMFYQTTINATQKTIKIPIIIENDTCRVLFDSLNIDRPFIGM